MHHYLAITKALGDETRVRALVSLAGGELCVCQIIQMLGLSPATVSKHMTILLQAGLVQRRKDGRWHYYRLPGRDAPKPVRDALRWTLKTLEGETRIHADAKALGCVRRKTRQESARCYTAR